MTTLINNQLGLAMYAVFTMTTGGGFSVLFQGTLAECQRFEIDYAGCWLNGMRIAPITNQ